MSNNIDNIDIPEGHVLCGDDEIRPIEQCVETDDGEWYSADLCVRCADEEWRLREECVNCLDGNWYPEDDCVVMSSGGYMPAESDEICCTVHGDHDWIDSCVQLDDGEWYPSDEVSCCDSCNEYVRNDDIVYGPGDTPLCDSCHADSCTCCDRCGDSEWDDETTESDDGEILCRDCADPPRPQLIAGYGDRSANRMPPESKDKLLFGVELEVEARDGDSYAAATFIRNHLKQDYSVLKTDGSLGPGGIEIVTRPDSVEVHRRKWEPLFAADPAQILKSWTTGRCGMHVHVSRRPLSQLQLGKMLCFLNEPANEKFIIKVAGRRSDRWSRIYKKKVTDIWSPAERYVALNLCNERTVEFRIFRGTLNKVTFFKNIEFCQALVEFTAPANHSIAEATSAAHFINWVDHHKYPNLYDWLVRLGFVADRRKRRSA